MFRSLVFTILLEEPEFGRLEMNDGSRVVTDAEERVRQDQANNPSLTLAAAMEQYIRDVTANRTCEPGIWQRYVDALKASDERKAQS